MQQVSKVNKYVSKDVKVKWKENMLSKDVK